MSYVAVTDDNFDDEVLKATEPVLVDFWAPWCGPCRMVGPIIEKLAEEFAGKVKIAKLNVDENPATAQKYAIMSIPTMKFFKSGEVAEEMIGAQPENILREKLTEYAGS